MALTPRERWSRAQSVIPGGVNSPVRAMRAVGLDEPLFIEDDDHPIEPYAYTALRVADLVAGVKGLKSS